MNVQEENRRDNFYKWICRLSKIVLVVALLTCAFSTVGLVASFFYSPPLVFSQNANSNGKLAIVGARGRSTDWEFTPQLSSVDGMWAAPNGLSFSFRNPQTGTEFQIPTTEPTTPEQEWGNSIPSKNSSQPITINGSFVLPTVPPPETQSVTGKLAGLIIFPAVRVEAGTEVFANESITLNEPVTLEVVTADRFEQILAEHRSQVRRFHVKLMFSSLAVVIVCIVLLVILDR